MLFLQSQCQWRSQWKLYVLEELEELVDVHDILQGKV